MKAAVRLRVAGLPQSGAAAAEQERGDDRGDDKELLQMSPPLRDEPREF
jgi:hypothetical protein